MVGAGALIVGAFLKWTRDIVGTDLSWKAAYQSTFGAEGAIERTVGGGAVLLGILALVGLAERSGWLTRVCGALGVAGVILVSVQIHRSSDRGLQAGLWIVVTGAVICVIGGMATVREVVVAPVAMPAVAMPSVTTDEDDE